jgi:hypothetical protein
MQPLSSPFRYAASLVFLILSAIQFHAYAEFLAELYWFVNRLHTNTRHACLDDIQAINGFVPFASLHYPAHLQQVLKPPVCQTPLIVQSIMVLA